MSKKNASNAEDRVAERMAAERALVEAFVVPQKRDRVIMLLSNAKRRAKVLKELDHFRHLDLRYATRLPPHLQTRPGILALLLEKGAPESCWVISADRSIDRRRLTLSEALDIVFGRSVGTLLSCIPGRLGYYEGEGAGERYVLRREGA